MRALGKKRIWLAAGLVTTIGFVTLIDALESRYAPQPKLYEHSESDIVVSIIQQPPETPSDRNTISAAYRTGSATYDLHAAYEYRPAPGTRISVECNGREVFKALVPGGRWRGLQFAPRELETCSGSFQLGYMSEKPEFKREIWDVADGNMTPAAALAAPLPPTRFGGDFRFPGGSATYVTVDIRLADRTVESISLTCMPNSVHPSPSERLAFNPEAVELLGSGDEWCRAGKIPVRLGTLGGGASQTFDLQAGARADAEADKKTQTP